MDQNRWSHCPADAVIGWFHGANENHLCVIHRRKFTRSFIHSSNWMEMAVFQFIHVGKANVVLWVCVPARVIFSLNIMDWTSDIINWIIFGDFVFQRIFANIVSLKLGKLHREFFVNLFVLVGYYRCLSLSLRCLVFHCWTPIRIYCCLFYMFLHFQFSVDAMLLHAQHFVRCIVGMLLKYITLSSSYRGEARKYDLAGLMPLHQILTLEHGFPWDQ